MSAIEAQIRKGAYYDSIVLMHLQAGLADQPGVLDAGVVMGTEANKGVLAGSGLLTAQVEATGADDLVIVVRGEDRRAAQAALGRVDELLARRKSGGVDQAYRPKSLQAAVRTLPKAGWVLVSVPGRYAAGVARQALRLGKHVFLYSDNVSLEDELTLKRTAAQKGLLVMGPDCGTAIVSRVGLGFANVVRRGSIGMVAASGTGLQQVSVRVHQLGSGISHALGTGGRDLTAAVNAITARQALELLSRDQETKVIVLVSKPPDPAVAEGLVRAARLVGKPVVVNFIGYARSTRRVDEVHFTTTFDETARLAVALAGADPERGQAQDFNLARFTPGQRYLRGLFSGGTLAYEALHILGDYLPRVYSNTPLKAEDRLADALESQEHTIIDLGEDEFTVGRLHPMIDNQLRVRRIEKEASDPAVAAILLDIVLGYGAHPDPAAELAPAIARARHSAAEDGRYLEVVAIVSGTDEDPQEMDSQVTQLESAGARVYTSSEQAVRRAGRLVSLLDPPDEVPGKPQLAPVDPGVLEQPLAAINVGLETFAESLVAQGAQVVQVDWRPPAGGDERLIAILERMQDSG